MDQWSLGDPPKLKDQLGEFVALLDALQEAGVGVILEALGEAFDTGGVEPSVFLAQQQAPLAGRREGDEVLEKSVV